MDALFEKEMFHSDQTLAKIAGCFTTDNRKNTTKRLCLSFLCYIIIKYHFNTLSQSQDTSKILGFVCVCAHMICFPDSKAVQGLCFLIHNCLK